MLDRLYPSGTFTGNYRTSGDIHQADCLIAHTFGVGPDGSTGGLSNESLADYAIDLRHKLGGICLIVTAEIASVMKEEADHVTGGPLANWIGVGTGTWGELKQSKQIMDQYGLSRPILIAHSYHIGRVARQAELQSINPIIPEGLPGDFDQDSSQTWTRGRLRWAIRTVPGNIVLMMKSQL